MLDLSGKTAVISGGADGIGFSLARALGAQGMNIVLADIEAKQLETARRTLDGGRYTGPGRGDGRGAAR
jgi:NAD(P)-dependent dehydrogenase (short-subunit alcohol dehydrogenase family)